ncbi:MAG: galactokinase family protein [Bacteroidota bacterium]
MIDVNKLKEDFLGLYGTGIEETLLFFAPGRINLIGEHTDYNGGFVFPCALSFGTYLFIRPNTDSIARFASTNFSFRTELGMGELSHKQGDEWINYPLGVMDQFARRGFAMQGFDMLFSGDIPNGAGLSSSASIEMVTAVALDDLLHAGLDRVELVKMGRAAENEFVGMNCGISLVRSSGEREDRQAGLSQFIIDLSLPGVTVRPIRDLSGDAHFSEVFFDNVQLAGDALVGAEGSGWTQVNAELAFERSGPERIYSSIVLLELWIRLLRQSPVGQAPAAKVGRLAAHLAALRNMSITVTAKLAQGESPVVEAALVKDLGTEFEQMVPQLIEASMGVEPQGELEAELHRTLAYVSQMAPSYSLRGGTREILRGMIARGLGLR